MTKKKTIEEYFEDYINFHDDSEFVGKKFADTTSEEENDKMKIQNLHYNLWKKEVTTLLHSKEVLQQDVIRKYIDILDIERVCKNADFTELDKDFILGFGYFFGKHKVSLLKRYADNPELVNIFNQL